MSDDDEVPKHNSRKNTRKWCKGKKGVKHQGHPHIGASTSFGHTSSFGHASWVKLICRKCGRELEWWWPFYNWKEAPDWVPKAMRATVRARFEKHGGF